MQLRVDLNGNIHCLYDESIDLSALGRLSIRRAGRVEPDRSGQWWADLSPLKGPRLGPYRRRSKALAAEETWVERFLFNRTTDPV
jgi:hypothetical protein